MFARTGSALDDVNESFHDAYDSAREKAELDAPVIVVLGDSLLLFRRGERSEVVCTPALVHVLKSIAHCPIGLFVLLHREVSSRRGPASNEDLARMQARIVASLTRFDVDMTDADAADDARMVLQQSLVLIERAGGGAPIDAPTLATFAKSMGQPLMHVTDAATRVQLAALHESVEATVAPLDAHERRTLHIVVAGVHQARARSLPMQYFQKRLGEPDGVEVRVTYGEGIEDEKAALALVGTRRLDHAIARAFFGDARRLQRDILGDAAFAQLAALPLAPLA